jgi:hypothetical protein
MSEHTPLPWSVLESDADAREPFVAVSEPDEYGNAPDLHIAVCHYSGNNYDPATLAADKAKAKANAEFIVRACNCHDELLEACKELVSWYDSDKSQRASVTFAAFDAVRAAIAKAEEKNA